ncbi:hypothetical protein D3C86_1930070 [compost metagenome]
MPETNTILKKVFGRLSSGGIMGSRIQKLEVLAILTALLQQIPIQVRGLEE